MNKIVQGLMARMTIVLASLVLAATAIAADARYIVMMDSAANFQKAANSSFVRSASTGNYVARTNSFLGTNARPQAALRNLNMFVVSANEAQVNNLKSAPGVTLVEQEKFFPAPRPMPMYGTLSPMGASPVARPSNKPPTMPWGIKAVHAPEAWDASNRGDGVRVLVLDTGFDKSHPAVSARLEEGRDFVGDNISPYPFFDQVGHGTHVAGTILADSLQSGFVGVAPNAKLLAGRVCDTHGCSTLAIIAGINWGIEKKVGVINMSLGGPISSSAQKRAAEAADKANIVIVAASGNDGTPQVGFPAAYPTVLAVGAVDEKIVKAKFSQWGAELDVVAPGVDVISSVPVGSGRETAVQITIAGKTELVPSSGMTGAPEMPNGISNSLVFCELGKEGQFPSAVRGKFALISRGEITFADKVKGAIAAGAVGTIIFNNEPGLISGSLTEDGSEVKIPVVMITQDSGNAVKKALEGNVATSATIQSFRTDYAAFQGTSMASPHAAGVVALVRGANSALTPQQVRQVLQETTSALNEPNDQNQWGKGLVNAEAAVRKALSMKK